VTCLTRLPDGEAVARRCAEELARTLQDALEQRGVAHFALSGGRTPGGVYELLAHLLPDWSGVELWYGDERCVGPEDAESTHRLVVETLLSQIDGPPPLEHRVAGERGAEAAADAYERELRARVAPAEDAPAELAGVPALDVALLGIGEDGHTASLFPGHAAVGVRDALCVAVHDAPKPPPDRVTLSLPVLRAARRCVLLATGAAKADALAAMLARPDTSVPASLLVSEHLHVIADEAAAAPHAAGAGERADGGGR
jgi:6-phosphogluconolactonase